MRAAYDDIAGWYDTLVRSDTFAGHVALPHLLDLLGDVRGQSICDLACGQGRIARALAQRGAHVVGVDLSAELIAIALRDEAASPRGIRYVVDDAQSLPAIADAQFDGVVCHLSLMDIPGLDTTFRAVWRVLRSHGWFVFTITHPCFEAPHAAWRMAPDGTVSREIQSYFTEGFWRSANPDGVRGRVGAYHRTLATYVNTLVQAGFAIERMLEPQATGAVVARVPGYQIVPSLLLLRCTRG